MLRLAKAGSSPTTPSAAITRSSSLCEKPAAEATSRSTRLRISRNRAAWKDSATAPTCSWVGRPSSRQTPLVGVVNPAMIQARVDLPEPLPPWISTPSPCSTTKLMSRSAVFAHGVPMPYSWPTPISSRAGACRVSPTPACGIGASTAWTMPVLSGESLSLIVRSADSASLL